MTRQEAVGISNIPPEVQHILATDPFILSLRAIDSITPVSGGVAHHVYRITDRGVDYYLKIRGDRFASIPSIACDPNDINHEFRALTLLGTRVPGIVPNVLSFDPSHHYLVLSDALRGGTMLGEALTEPESAIPLYRRFGQTLRAIHDGTADITDPVRVGGDEEYYQRLLGHRFGYRNHPALTRLVQQLSALPDRRFIMGDFAPKNIAVPPGNGHFTVFDLETSHMGNTVFDYGYGLAHVVLHSAPNEEIMTASAASYRDGYGEESFDPELVRTVTRGILLYRLNSIVPYPTRLNADQRREMEDTILKTLDENESTNRWTSLGVY